MSRRLIVAFLFLVVAAALLLLAWPVTQQVPPPATVAVVIDGPEGIIWNGTATATPGTALAALLNASEQGGFTVETTGPVGQRYVASIAGFDDAEGGWCFQVNGFDGDRSGDEATVQDGWGVRWYWTDGQCDRY